MSYELIKNYDKSKHLETLEKNDFKFEYVLSQAIKNDNGQI